MAHSVYVCLKMSEGWSMVAKGGLALFARFVLKKKKKQKQTGACTNVELT